MGKTSKELDPREQHGGSVWVDIWVDILKSCRKFCRGECGVCFGRDSMLDGRGLQNRF